MNVLRICMAAAGLVLPFHASLAQSDRPKPDAQDFQTMIWAASCAACHGPDGKAEGTGMTIGGRPAAELQNLLLSYKYGKREGTIMHQHARGYSDDELRRIALYFSQLKKK